MNIMISQGVVIVFDRFFAATLANLLAGTGDWGSGGALQNWHVHGSSSTKILAKHPHVPYKLKICRMGPNAVKHWRG